MTVAMAHALRQALYLILLLAAPPLVAVLAVGVATAFLQSATQLRERTVSTVPKLVAALLALAASGPWIGAQLSAFLRAMLEALPGLGRS
jgi:flagellar biosynthesis protein FliQ